jgi:hypothetical protein
MRYSENKRPIPNDSVDERRARELVKLVRKLRWIGEDQEAEQLQTRLRAGNGGPCVLASPRDTD